MKKHWRRSLFFALGGLIVVVWIGLLAWGFRSKTSVEEYKAQLRAAGEKLDVKELIPPPVPPEQNAANIFREATKYLGLAGESTLETNPPSAMHIVAPGRAETAWEQPDIRGYDATNSWDDLGASLDPYYDAIHALWKSPATREWTSA